MKLYVFTKKDIDRFLVECNFTPDEERLFRLRCKEYTLEYLSLIHISEPTRLGMISYAVI